MTEFFYQTPYQELVHVLVLNKDGVLHVFYFIYNQMELTGQGLFHLAADGTPETQLDQWAFRKGYAWQKIDSKAFKARRPVSKRPNQMRTKLNKVLA